MKASRILFLSAALLCFSLVSYGSAASRRFACPDNANRPFVRWWWNGDRVEADELVRELRMLKEQGIGGVEINPIEFPVGAEALDTKELTWLGDEWIDMLKVVFDEAAALGMDCDLIVGSGWPFGSESLPREDRASVMLTYAEKVAGGSVFESSRYNILAKLDPGVTVTNPRRTGEIVSVLLAPDPINDLSEVIDLTADFEGRDIIEIKVPEGPHCVYVLARFDSFASVINGAPGAAGSILNHMDAAAVRRYLDHMSDAIEARIGPLSQYLRSFFVDSMELEGCNWTSDFAEEFKARRGYDVMPWLPLIMFKVGRLGEAMDYNYGAAKSDAFKEQVGRVRFDFELTKAELLHERFTRTYLQWCRDKGVKSRAQTYGRGFFPLETALDYDIPEGESWTTNWLRHRLGEEMGDEDYRRGRGYTMINKYVSSAANLSGNRMVSSEEMTNTYKVFYTSQEFLKLGSDMGAFSGTTHSVWSGFNYSPHEASFPGWVQYGSFTNEKNPCWPYFRLLNDYRARISSILQNADMQTDIAILPANYDLWTTLGVQTDPFPWYLNVPYTSLIWEAIHKCGGGADYVSENILAAAEVKNGKICYGPKEYGTIFLPEVTSTTPVTLRKLLAFVKGGGRVFCIGCVPSKSLGFKDFAERDKEIRGLVDELRKHPDGFILLDKPADGRYLEWYQDLMAQYGLPHSVTISNPDRFLLQNHYRMDDGTDAFLLVNAHLHEALVTDLVFPAALRKGRICRLYNPADGKRYRLRFDGGKVHLRLGPTETYLILFEKDNAADEYWSPLPVTGSGARDLADWKLRLHHPEKGWTKDYSMQRLSDVQQLPGFADFMGDITYSTTLHISGKVPRYINLGKVCEICELSVNGRDCGVRWFGERIYDISGLLREGDNEIVVKVATLTGNYVRTLPDNAVARRFILSRNQSVAPMGLLGPVTVYD